MSFLMTAVRASFGGFPASRRVSYFLLRSGSSDSMFTCGIRPHFAEKDYATSRSRSIGITGMVPGVVDRLRFGGNG